MATFINKLFGKNKEKATMPLEPHAARFIFDYTWMPHVAGLGTSNVFVDGDDNHEIFYDWMKDINELYSFSTSVKLNTYKIKEGQLAVFTFPEPEASPEVKYGICVFNVEEAERQNRNPYETPNPYYILAKIVDVWTIGEIKPHPQQSNDYVTTYYKTIETPDLRQFMKWVMDREILHMEDCYDPLGDYFHKKDLAEF